MRDRKVSNSRISVLVKKANEIRIDIINMTYRVGPEHKAHPGGALSATDIITALYFDIMNLDPSIPKWKERDRFILSKGHACPALYAALAQRGFFDKKEYDSLRRVDGMLQGHPDMKRIPGVDMTTGSLGHGLAAGLGIALSSRIDKLDFHVFVLIGDGECDEGLVWEAALGASKYKANNLTAIVDVNGLQSCGTSEELLPMEPIIDKWASFGWNVIDIDGHDMNEIVASLELAKRYTLRPTVIIAHTVKGKGVSFMENDNSWHQRAPNEEQYRQAIKELRGESNYV